MAFPRVITLAGTPDHEILRILNDEYDANLAPQLVAKQKLAINYPEASLGVLLEKC